MAGYYGYYGHWVLWLSNTLNQSLTISIHYVPHIQAHFQHRQDNYLAFKQSKWEPKVLYCCIVSIVLVVIIFEGWFKFFDEYKTVNFLNLCQTLPSFVAAAQQALLPTFQWDRGDPSGMIPSL